MIDTVVLTRWKSSTRTQYTDIGAEATRGAVRL